MTRTGWLRGLTALAAVTVALPASAAPSPDDKSALGQVPANAPLVVHVHGVERTKDRVIALMKNALPDLAPTILAKIEEGFKKGMEGRKLDGLAKDGPIFLVFTEMPHPGTEPKVAVIAAVTNYEDFRNGILKDDERKNLKKDGTIESTTLDNGESIFLIDRKGFVVATPSKDVADALAKNPAGLAGKVSEAVAAKFLASDVGLFVNLDPINKEYAEQIKQMREKAEEGFKQIEEQVGKSQQQIFQVLQKLIGPVFQAVQDGQAVLVTLEARPQAAALHAQIEVRDGSQTANLLKDAKPSAFADLGKLPAGRTIYTGFRVSPKTFETLAPLMLGASSDGEGAKSVKAALDEMVQAKPGDREDAMSVPPAGLSVWKYGDPAKAVDAQLKLLQATAVGGTLQSGVLKEKPVIKTKAQKVGDFELNSVHLVWDLEKMAEAGGAGLPENFKTQMAAAMKQLMGEEMNYWFGTDGKVFVQVTAKDWASAQKLLEQYVKGQNTVGAQAAFRDARKELPAEASVLALFDVVQYGGVMVDFVKAMAGGVLPIPNFAAPDKDKAYYAGMAFTLQPRGAGMDLMVTATAINGIYTTYVKPLLGGRPAPGAAIQ